MQSTEAILSSRLGTKSTSNVREVLYANDCSKGNEGEAMTRAEQLRLAALYRRAADCRLSETDYSGEGTRACSCDALHRDNGCYADDPINFRNFFDIPYWGGFDEFEPGIERQGARFLTLDMIAEGLERGMLP